MIRGISSFHPKLTLAMENVPWTQICSTKWENDVTQRGKNIMDEE